MAQILCQDRTAVSWQCQSGMGANIQALARARCRSWEKGTDAPRARGVGCRRPRPKGLGHDLFKSNEINTLSGLRGLGVDGETLPGAGSKAEASDCTSHAAKRSPVILHSGEPMPRLQACQLARHATHWGQAQIQILEVLEVRSMCVDLRPLQGFTSSTRASSKSDLSGQLRPS